MRRPRSDYDAAWKEILIRYFAAFLLFFFPAAHAEIDWSREVGFLESEMRYAIRVAANAPSPSRPATLSPHLLFLCNATQ